MADKSAVPFLLAPVGKDYLWGGSRLKDDFSKNLDMTPLAETWECSTHADGVCRAANGPCEGLGLDEILLRHPEFCGKHPAGGELPIMVKLIDAKGDLSVQVHPTDEYAEKFENGQRGKSEMWYVIDASEGASLIYGLSKDATKETIRSAACDGTLERYLQRVPIKKNDVFFIDAGMIHAIGAGALVAEVQECSNLTYRLYDYGRTDKNGKARELHVEKALDVADLSAATNPRQPMRVLKYAPGMARELLCRCKYFEVSRLLINTERCREMADYPAYSLSYRILLCTEGCGTITSGGEAFCFFRGDCIFVPATSGDIKIHGRAVFLDIRS